MLVASESFNGSAAECLSSFKTAVKRWFSKKMPGEKYKQQHKEQ